MGRSFGWQLCGAQIGMATGGWIGGILFSIFGDYIITIGIAVAASLLGSVVIMTMDNTDRVLIEEWELNLPQYARSEGLLSGTS